MALEKFSFKAGEKEYHIDKFVNISSKFMRRARGYTPLAAPLFVFITYLEEKNANALKAVKELSQGEVQAIISDWTGGSYEADDSETFTVKKGVEITSWESLSFNDVFSALLSSGNDFAGDLLEKELSKNDDAIKHADDLTWEEYTQLAEAWISGGK